MADRSWRRRQLREADRRYGPDRSEVLFEFHDRWTIRRPLVVADCWREGFLQHNCLEKQDYGDAAGHYFVGVGDWISPEPDAPRYRTVIHSLRDVDNFPHVTFGHNPSDGVTAHAFGHATTQPKREYLDRIELWHLTLAYPVEYEVHVIANDPDPTCPAVRGNGSCPEADAVGAQAA